MGSLARIDLNRLMDAGVKTLYETGTGKGHSIIEALKAGFESIHTVESYAPLYEAAVAQFTGNPQVSLALDDSVNFIRKVAAQEAGPRLFFLDAHFHGGADFDGKNNRAQTYIESAKHERSFPLEEELETLLSKEIAQDWIVIDDARIYVAGAFGRGACPDWAQQFSRYESLQKTLKKFEATHHIHFSRQDEGYWVLSPLGATLQGRDILKVLPTDPAGEPPGIFELRTGVPGVTSISIARRSADHRFATRYFKGYGLDVGAGPDSLAIFREFFPLIRNVAGYDFQNGDAQKLMNVADNSFDFIYSSHCLEHLRDPVEALENWIRVTKPGGYLVIQVPDEDLYEQGQWPSRYNSDHKLTFTIKKTKSWSPVSINVLDLLGQFADRANILQVGLEDRGYRYSLADTKIDQTRMPMSESAIEFVLQKR